MALAPILFHEKLTLHKCLGFLVVLVGVFLINGQAAQEGKTLWGLFCGGMSAVMYAVLVIANKKVTHIVGMENVLYQLLFSTVTVAIFPRGAVLLDSGRRLAIRTSAWRCEYRSWVLSLFFIYRAAVCAERCGFGLSGAVFGCGAFGSAAAGGYESPAASGRGMHLRWRDACGDGWEKDKVLLFRIKEAVKHSLVSPLLSV